MSARTGAPNSDTKVNSPPVRGAYGVTLDLADGEVVGASLVDHSPCLRVESVFRDVPTQRRRFRLIEFYGPVQPSATDRRYAWHVADFLVADRQTAELLVAGICDTLAFNRAATT